MVWVFPPPITRAQDLDRATEVVSAIEKENQQICQNQSPDICDRAELLTDKYCKMSDSAFPFYRATNYLFWDDFSKNEDFKKFSNEKTKTWIRKTSQNS